MFFVKTVLPPDKMNMSHFLNEMAEQILMRYQVKVMNAQLLSMLFGLLCPDHMGAPPHNPTVLKKVTSTVKEGGSGVGRKVTKNEGGSGIRP